MRTIFALVAVAFLGAVFVMDGLAQSSPAPADSVERRERASHAKGTPRTAAGRLQVAPGATQHGWADRHRVRLLDRFNTLARPRHDRGAFLHVMPEMDREYELDLLTYRFTPLQQYRWKSAESGFQSRGGSIERTDFALVSELKQSIPLTDKTVDQRPLHEIDLNLYLREDVQAQRSLIEFAYRRRFAGGHAAGVRHTFSEYKPDLDLSLFYQVGEFGLSEDGAPRAHDGIVRAEVTLMDVYNDFISSSLGIDVEDQDVVREYGRKPFLLQLHAVTPSAPVQAEVVGGIQPLSEAEYTSQTDPGFRYRDDRTLHYVAGMVAGRVPGRWIGVDGLNLTAGLTARRDYSRVHRVGLGPSVSSTYTARQTRQSAGGFLEATYGDLRAEVWYSRQAYTDRQTGEDYALSLVPEEVDYREDRSHLNARAFYEPGRPWPYVGLGYANVIRDYPQPLGDRQSYVLSINWTEKYFVTGPSNYRATLLVGYSFDERGFLEIGVHYDTDGDIPTEAEGLPERGPDSQRKKRFDNGFARLVLLW